MIVSLDPKIKDRLMSASTSGGSNLRGSQRSSNSSNTPLEEETSPVTRPAGVGALFVCYSTYGEKHG